MRCGTVPGIPWSGCGVEVDGVGRTTGVQKKLNKLSLIVFEQNAGAKRLYERLGYREVARKAIYPHPLVHFTGDAILMARDI